MVKKSWPKWVKILAIISLIVIILLEAGLVMVFLFLKSAKDFPSSMSLLILIALMIYYFLVVVGLWVLGFLMRYLVKRKLYLIANILAAAGLIISFIWLLKQGIGNISSFSLSLGQFVTGIMLHGWSIAIIIYFIVALVLINKTRKQY